MVIVVALQSSKTATLLGPKFESQDYNITSSRLEIVSRYSNSRALGGLLLMIFNQVRIDGVVAVV